MSSKREGAGRAVWKVRVGYVLWLAATAAAVAGLGPAVVGPFSYIGHQMDVFDLTAVGVAYIAIVWELGRMRHTGARRTLRALLIIVPLLAIAFGVALAIAFRDG